MNDTTKIAPGGRKRPKNLEKRPDPAPPALTRWMKVFLTAYAETGIMRTALKTARVSVSTLRKYRETVPEFDIAVRDAEADAADLLEAEVRRRAMEGTERPIYQGGKLVGHERTYSDFLLWRLLCARRPAYRETRGTAVKTPDGTQIIVFEAGPGLDSLPWGDRNARMPEIEENGGTEEN